MSAHPKTTIHTWKEVKPGIWERAIGENEKFIKWIGDRAQSAGLEHWSVTASGTFTLNIAMTATELSSKCIESWCALRFQHPSIACSAEGDFLSYIVPDSDSIAAWASETFIIHDSDVSTDDVVANLKPSRFSTAHLVPREQSILLHFSHWRTDGHGSLHLINAFLEKLCRVVSGEDMCLNWGEEVDRLAPTVEEALAVPTIATPDIVASTKRCMSTAAYLRGAAGVKIGGERSIAPRGTRCARLRLSEADSMSVLAACDTLSVSMTSAVHASCAALTHLEASSDARDKPYTSTMRFSLRPHLPEPYGSPNFAAALFTAGYMFRVPASQSWLTNARQFEDEYQHGVTPGFLKCRRQYAVDVLHVLQQGPPPLDPPQSEIDISSVGNAEAMVCPRYARGVAVLEVEDISVRVETVTRQIYCFVWLFRGHIELSLVYNEAYYDAGRVAKMVQRLEGILNQESATASSISTAAKPARPRDT